MAKVKRCYRCDLPIDAVKKDYCESCKRINKREVAKQETRRAYQETCEYLTAFSGFPLFPPIVIKRIPVNTSATSTLTELIFNSYQTARSATQP